MSYYSTVLADSPAIYYRCNETSGTVVHDFSGNGNDGTLLGTITYGVTGAIAGDSDTALAFDYAGGIALPARINPLTWSALTLECWMDTGSGFQNVIVTADNAGGATTIYLNGSQVTPGSTAAIEIGADLTFVGSGQAATFDEFALYQYKFTQTQIDTHLAAASGTSSGGSSITAYTYGPFQINAHSGGLGYFLVAKDLDFPTYKPSLSPIARQELWKINGWQVDARTIQVDLVVVGTSRDDCIARKDILEQALSLRDQPLVIHSDGRYWTANATAGKVKFSAGTGIVQARIPVSFICADPYAKAALAATPYDTGSLTYTQSGSSYNSPTFTFAGGGTVYSWPQLHLTNKTPNLGSTIFTSALVQGQSYNAIFVSNTTFSAVAGTPLILYYNTGTQLWMQRVVVSSGFAINTIQINVQAFTAAYNFPATTKVYVSTAWNQVTISQVTDNYTLSVTSTTAAPLPQVFGDYLDIYTAPDTGMYITTNGLSQYLDFTGAFPPLEPGNTQWQVSIAADSQPTVDVVWAWTSRYLS